MISFSWFRKSHVRRARLARVPAGSALAGLAVCVLLTGCGGGSGTGDRSGGAKGGRGGTSSAGDPPLCDPAGGSIEDGALPPGGSVASDARATGRMTLVRQGDCSRIRLALLADATSKPGASPSAGAPAANPGPLRGAMLRSLGIVRIALPSSIEVIAQADTTIEGGEPVGAAYVVHARDGSFYFDVHLDRAALVQAVALSSPARLLVDAWPGGGAVPGPASAERNVVVLEPRSGAATFPLAVRGYARTFEANVIARLSREGKVVAQAHATAADWSLTWGEYEITIPSGPAGPLELFVGEDDAESGRERGVRIPVVMQ